MTDCPWQPTIFLRHIETIGSSSRTAIIQTDAGRAYLKAINNPQSPHILACDWIGTKLAQRFGLKTFDVAILELDDGDEIQLDQKTLAAIGPSFVARGEKGAPSVSPSSLRQVQNLEDISLLVIFDTWVRNCDRHRPADENEPERINQDNLFLSEEGADPGKFILKAIDHGHIFTCGRSLTRNLTDIANVKDERLYGVLQAFRNRVSVANLTKCTAEKLQNVSIAFWADLIDSVPNEWQVTAEAKAAISRFLLERARFLTDNIESIARQSLGDKQEEN